MTRVGRLAAGTTIALLVVSCGGASRLPIGGSTGHGGGTGGGGLGAGGFGGGVHRGHVDGDEDHDHDLRRLLALHGRLHVLERHRR